MERIAPSLPTSLALICLALVLGLWYWVLKPNTPNHFAPGQGILDEYMVNAQAMEYNDLGELSREMNIGYWSHLIGSPITNMTNPHLKIYQKDASWDLKSNYAKGHQGEVQINFTQIDLEESVKIVRTLANGRVWRMQTKALSIYPKEGFSITQQPLIISSQGLKVHAGGMKALLNDDAIELFKAVDTNYQMDDSDVQKNS